MKQITRALAFVFALAFVAGCGGGATYLQLAQQRGGESIAVVSLSVNRYSSGFRGGFRDVVRSPFMVGNARRMVEGLEQQLAAHYAVVPATEFVATEEFQSLAQPRPDVALPDFDGWEMPVFGYSYAHLEKARLAPEMAQALAAATGTDLIALVYSEWGAKTGSFVPTSKALVVTTLSIYDASGKLLYTKRTNALGTKTLGAFGSVVLDENSIEEWVGAYFQTLLDLVSR